MTAESDTSDPVDPAARPWQFSLGCLLLTPVALAVPLGFFIWTYPYSLYALPCSVVPFLILVVVRLICGTRVNAGGLAVVGFVVYVVVTLITAGCVDPSEPARRSQCANNLKEIAIALHNYYDRYGSFPPAYIADEDGRPMHSWRVLILPYLQRLDIYEQYRFDEPWNGPNNSRLAIASIYEYRCPEQPPAGNPMTNYVAVVGPGTMWPGARSIKFEDIRDGTANTLMIVEIANSGIHWMEPRDLDFSAMPMAVNPPNAPGISSLHREVGWRRRLLGANAARADCSTVFLPTSTPAEKIRGLLTVAGGEDVGLDDLNGAR